MEPALDPRVAAMLQEQLLAKEAALQREIESLQAKLQRRKHGAKTQKPSARPKRRAEEEEAEEEEEDDRPRMLAIFVRLPAPLMTECVSVGISPLDGITFNVFLSLL